MECACDLLDVLHATEARVSAALVLLHHLIARAAMTGHVEIDHGDWWSAGSVLKKANDLTLRLGMGHTCAHDSSAWAAHGQNMTAAHGHDRHGVHINMRPACDDCLAETGWQSTGLIRARTLILSAELCVTTGHAQSSCIDWHTQ